MIQNTLVPLDEMPQMVAPSIRRHAAAADRDRRLPAELVDDLRAAGAFSLTTPRSLGGHEATMVELMETYEAFGTIDGPTAWNIWNGATGFCAALMDDDAIAEIWGEGVPPIIANSAKPNGGALVDGDDFVLSGRWEIVSAIDISDWAVLFGMVLEGGAPRMTPMGPDVRAFFVRTSEVTILDTWHTTGMRGSGSNSVVADRVRVPARRAISPFAPARAGSAAVYNVPAFTIASHGAAPIVVGIAQAALDEIVEMAPTKATDRGVLAEQTSAQEKIGACATALHGARLLLRDAAAQIDAAAAAGAEVTVMLRARLRAAISHAGVVSRDVLHTCQRLASSSAVYSANRIEQLVRDGIVADQHMILAEHHAEILGRLMLGQEAGTPVV